jgi:hypothetical protein
LEGTLLSVPLLGPDVEGIGLVYEVLTMPAHGTLTGLAPLLAYLPNPQFSGVDSFRVRIVDLLLETKDITVSLSIAPVNDAPVAFAQSVSVAEGGVVGIELGGSDPEGGALTYSVVVPPSQGVLEGTAPNLVYRPRAQYAGGDYLEFTVSDGALTSARARVSITVTPVDDPPVALGQTVAVQEDGQVDIVLRGVDPEGGPLVFGVVRGPSHGALAGTPPLVRYQPAANFFGSDSFEFRVTDASGAQGVGTVVLQVEGVNDKPVVYPLSLTVAQNGSAEVVLKGFDVEGSPLSFDIPTPPQNGTLSGSGSNWVYRPKAQFAGTDRFEYWAKDTDRVSDREWVTITVVSVNSAPSAIAQSVTLAEDSSVAIQLAGKDPDSDVLSFSITRQPAKGVLSGAPPAVSYVPAKDYAGSDSFEFRVDDGKGGTATAVVSLQVTAVNDAPVAGSRMVGLAEDSTVSVVLTASDVDHEAASLVYAVIEAPAEGVLEGTPPNVVYRPRKDFFGADQFRFRVTDPAGGSSVGMIQLAVDPVNDAPVAAALAVTVARNDSVAVVLSGFDVEKAPLTYLLDTAPGSGSLSGSAPNLTYRPAVGFVGVDSFRYRVSDGALASAPATVSITVLATNRPPVVSPTSLVGTEDTMLPFELRATDPDGDAVQVSITRGPTNGVLVGSVPMLGYQPVLNYFGADSFEYRAVDDQGGVTAGVVTIQVDPINDPPVPVPMALTVPQNGRIAITLAGTDVDSTQLFYALPLGSYPANGVLRGTAPNLEYEPNPGFAGTDSFEFLVSDGLRISGKERVTITVVQVNAAPVADARQVAVAEDGSVAITVSARDADGDPLAYSLVRGPANGVLSGVLPNVRYEPSTNYFGSDSFEFRVQDGRGGVASAVISLNVTPVNDVPVATPASHWVVYGSPTAVVLRGRDVEGDALTYRVVSGPAQGALSGTAPNLVYTPGVGFTGEDSFTYVVNDGRADSAAATVTLRISLILATESTPVQVSTGAKALGLVPEVVADPVHGELGMTGDGDLVYRHAADGSTLDSFSFRMGGETNTVAVHIVGFREFRRLGNVKMTFGVLAGLKYRIEELNLAPTASRAWTTYYDTTPAVPALVTVPLPVPNYDITRFVRLVCEGFGQRVVSEAWGIHTAGVSAGVDGRVFASAFRMETVYRGRVSSVAGGQLVFDSGRVVVPSMVSEASAGATHALFLRGSARPGSVVGSWWPILSQAGNRITVDERIESLAAQVSVGDEVECVRMPTVADLMGAAGTVDMRLGIGDRIEIEDLVGRRYAVECRGTTASNARYWVVRDGVSQGPFDGTTLTLLPYQAFHYSAKPVSGTFVSLGRVPDGPAVRYLVSGVRMAGNAFPFQAAVPELAAYGLASGEWPWLAPGQVGAGADPAWVQPSLPLPATGGVWVRVPEAVPVVRWVQQPPL